MGYGRSPSRFLHWQRHYPFNVVFNTTSRYRHFSLLLSFGAAHGPLSRARFRTIDSRCAPVRTCASARNRPLAKPPTAAPLTQAAPHRTARGYIFTFARTNTRFHLGDCPVISATITHRTRTRTRTRTRSQRRLHVFLAAIRSG